MNIWLRKCDKCGGQTDYEKCHICRENELKKKREENGKESLVR